LNFVLGINDVTTYKSKFFSNLYEDILGRYSCAFLCLMLVSLVSLVSLVCKAAGYRLVKWDCIRCMVRIIFLFHCGLTFRVGMHVFP